MTFRWMNNFGVRIYINDPTKVKEYHNIFGYVDENYTDVYVDVYKYRWQKYLQQPCFSSKIRSSVKEYSPDVFDWYIIDVNEQHLILKNNNTTVDIANLCD